MGLLTRLKKKIREFWGKEKRLPIDLELGKFEEWFEKKKEKIIAEKEEKISQKDKEIEEEIKKGEEKLQRLEKAELKNPHISEKEKQVMAGNRKNYVQGVQEFFKSLVVPATIENWKEFFQAFEKEIEKIAKTTNKSYQVLQAFFANESREVALVIKGLEEKINKTKEEILDEQWKRIKQIEKLIIKTKELQKVREKIIEEKEKLEEEIEKEKKKEEKLEAKKKAIENSEDFKNYLGLKKEIEKVGESKEESKRRLVQQFSGVKKGLKKYAYLTPEKDKEKLIAKYLDDEYSSLKEDEELKILEILEEIERKIDSIETNEEKREKIITGLKRLKEKLGKTREELAKEEKKEQAVQEKIRKNRIKNIYNDLVYRLGYIKKRLIKLKSRKKEEEEKLKNLPLEELIEKIENNLRVIFPHLAINLKTKQEIQTRGEEKNRLKKESREKCQQFRDNKKRKKFRKI